MSLLRKLFGLSDKASDEDRKDRSARDFEVLKYDGVAALKQHAVDYAVKCFTHALELKDDGETRDYLAHALIRQGNLDEAYRQLEHLAEIEPGNVAILLRMADVAYMMENYRAMTEVCEKANEIDSENVQVNYAYARACIGSEHFVNAIALLTKAINLSVDEPFWDAHLLKGQTLLKMGEVETAEREAGIILKAMPEQEDALLLKARCKEVGGDSETALALYDKVMELNPFCLDALRERAEIRHFMGDTQGAEADREVIFELLDNAPSGTTADEAGQDIAGQTEEAYKRSSPLA